MHRHTSLVVVTTIFALIVTPAVAQDDDAATAEAAAQAAANANNPLANMVAFNILHDGIGQPEFQIFAGLNMQFLPK